MIIILYGEMGSGKSYVGNALADKLNLPFYEGDHAIPAKYTQRKILCCIKSPFPFFSPDEVTDFVTHYLIPKITELKKKHDNIIIAQAMYSDKDRAAITNHFGKDEVLFVRVNVTWDQQKSQIRSRSGLFWVGYAYCNKPHFIKPKSQDELSLTAESKATQSLSYYSIENNKTMRKEDIVRQFEKIRELKIFFDPSYSKSTMSI